MEAKTFVKLAVLVVIALVVWKKGIPWWQERNAKTPAAVSSAGQGCAAAAAAASETWGSGVGRFANPPFDAGSWDEFRSRVEQQARKAQEQCLCAESSCTTAKGALSDLRGLINEMDASLRSGPPRRRRPPA